MEDLAQWLTSLPLSRTIRRTAWVIPLTQTIHILATAMVLSSVVMLDLRAWGAVRSHTPAESTRRFAPWIWIAMVLLIATGVMLVIGGPRRMLLDGAFQAKLAMTVLAIPVTLGLHIALRRGAPDGRVVVGITAAAALLLWLAITFASRGRWIAGFLSR